MKPNLFIRNFLILAVALTAALLGFVFSVDPYDRLGINPWHFETKVVAQSREAKFILFDNSKEKYEAVVMGSSVADRYRSDKVFQLTGFKTFNYSVDSGSMDDYILIARHAMAKNPPKLFIMALIVSELNEHIPPDERIGNSKLARYKTRDNTPSGDFFESDYLTLQALNDSLKTVYMNILSKNVHQFDKDGNVPEKKPDAPTIKPECGIVSPWSSSDIPDGNEYKFLPYQLSERRLNQLREIQEMSRKAGTRLIVILSPVDRKCYDRMVGNSKSHEMLRAYKAAIADAADEVYDFITPAVTPYSTPNLFFDSIHFSSDLSSLVLDAIFKGDPKGFGVRLAK